MSAFGDNIVKATYSTHRDTANNSTVKALKLVCRSVPRHKHLHLYITSLQNRMLMDGLAGKFYLVKDI